MIEDIVLNRIIELLEFNHWTPYKLAKESDIPYSSLNNLLNKKNCPTIPTLEKICNGFQISLGDFFELTKNPLVVPQLDPTEQDIINCYRRLTTKEKEAILVCLQGLSHK